MVSLVYRNYKEFCKLKFLVDMNSIVLYTEHCKDNNTKTGLPPIVNCENDNRILQWNNERRLNDKLKLTT